MNRKKALLFFVVCGLGLASCGNNPYDYEDDEYTVIWQNYNGDILEIDRNVKEGSIPSFDGATPIRDENGQYSYTFSKWEPEISAIHENTTYTAKYTSTIKTYTITWINDNGDVLEIDENVPYGTMPSYDGSTPNKDDNGNVRYLFKGWSPSISKVIESTTYTATYTEILEGDLIAGVDPVVSSDGKTVEYGFYPQTHVNDVNTIEVLETLTPTGPNGWYSYNGEYYTKEIAKIYNNETYTFDDNTAIVSDEAYWFKCEPIKWEILSNDDGSYFLLSSKLLNAHNYFENFSNRVIENNTIYANNYEQSDIRTWLNDDFYNTAFALNNVYIQAVNVSNNGSTTDAEDNNYVCNDTIDKVYLPSYQDYLNLDYGFDSDATNKSTTRECKTTDYARINGAWCNKDNNNGSYWTRSPSSEFYYCAWNVNSGGYLSTYAVDGDSYSVRPCIYIQIAK